VFIISRSRSDRNCWTPALVAFSGAVRTGSSFAAGSISIDRFISTKMAPHVATRRPSSTESFVRSSLDRLWSAAIDSPCERICVSKICALGRLNSTVSTR
jgi:hypothetical protein